MFVLFAMSLRKCIRYQNARLYNSSIIGMDKVQFLFRRMVTEKRLGTVVRDYATFIRGEKGSGEKGGLLYIFLLLAEGRVA